MNASLGTMGPSGQVRTDVEYNAATIGLTGATPTLRLPWRDTKAEQVIDPQHPI